MRERKILICDDEEDILVYLRKMLHAKGFAAETFHDGGTLLRALEEGLHDDAAVLLQDVNLPDIDGMTVMERAKELRPQMKVVIMTAHSCGASEDEAAERGAFDYLAKPFPGERVIAVLHDAVN